MYLFKDRRLIILQFCENILSIKEIYSELFKEYFSINNSIFVKIKDDDKISLFVDDRKFFEIMDMFFEKDRNSYWIVFLLFKE